LEVAVVPGRYAQGVFSPIVLQLFILPTGVDFIPTEITVWQEGAFLDGFVDGLKTDVQRQTNEFLVLAAKGLVHGVTGKGENVSGREITFHPVVFGGA